MQAHSHLLTPSYLKPYIPLGVSYSSEVVLALQTDCVGVTFTKFYFNTRMVPNLARLSNNLNVRKQKQLELPLSQTVRLLYVYLFEVQCDGDPVKLSSILDTRTLPPSVGPIDCICDWMSF